MEPEAAFTTLFEAMQYAQRKSKEDLNHTYAVQEYRRRDIGLPLAGLLFRVTRDDSKSTGDWRTALIIRSMMDDHLGQVVTISDVPKAEN